MLNITSQASKELNVFLVPTKAKLIDEKDGVNTYEWSRASEENGIPSDYEKRLNQKDGKKVKEKVLLLFTQKGSI